MTAIPGQDFLVFKEFVRTRPGLEAADLMDQQEAFWLYSYEFFEQSGWCPDFFCDDEVDALRKGACSLIVSDYHVKSRTTNLYVVECEDDVLIQRIDDAKKPAKGWISTVETLHRQRFGKIGLTVKKDPVKRNPAYYTRAVFYAEISTSMAGQIEAVACFMAAMKMPLTPGHPVMASLRRHSEIPDESQPQRAPLMDNTAACRHNSGRYWFVANTKGIYANYGKHISNTESFFCSPEDLVPVAKEAIGRVESYIREKGASSLIANCEYSNYLFNLAYWQEVGFTPPWKRNLA